MEGSCKMKFVYFDQAAQTIKINKEALLSSRNSRASLHTAHEGLRYWTGHISQLHSLLKSRCIEIDMLTRPQVDWELTQELVGTIVKVFGKFSDLRAVMLESIDNVSEVLEDQCEALELAYQLRHAF
ncbi:MAG: hypothetical protein Q9218_003252 [Villophora microphyllina]